MPATADLNFEAEPFGGFSGSHGGSAEEFETVVVSRGYGGGPAVRDHRGGYGAVVRDNRGFHGATVRAPLYYPGSVHQGRPWGGAGHWGGWANWQGQGQGQGRGRGPAAGHWGGGWGRGHWPGAGHWGGSGLWGDRGRWGGPGRWSGFGRSGSATRRLLAGGRRLSLSRSRGRTIGRIGRIRIRAADGRPADGRLGAGLPRPGHRALGATRRSAGPGNAARHPHVSSAGTTPRERSARRRDSGAAGASLPAGRRGWRCRRALAAGQRATHPAGRSSTGRARRPLTGSAKRRAVATGSLRRRGLRSVPAREFRRIQLAGIRVTASATSPAPAVDAARFRAGHREPATKRRCFTRTGRPAARAIRRSSQRRSRGASETRTRSSMRSFTLAIRNGPASR